MAVQPSRAVVGLVLLAAAAVVPAASGRWWGPSPPSGSDASSHHAEVAHVGRLLEAGESDFWFEGTNLGYPMFLAYQPGPTLLVGAVAAIASPTVSPTVSTMTLFKLSVILVWAFAPLAWWKGARWLGLGPVGALCFAVLSLAPSDFRHFGLGIGSMTETGLWTQSWGAALLPLATGALFQRLHGNEPSDLRAVALFVALALAHVFFGLLLGIAGILMVVVRQDGVGARAIRYARVLAKSLALLAFWLVPFVLYMRFQGGLPWKYDAESGWPAARVATMLVSGEIFDHGRIAWLTAAVLGGLALCALRRGETLPRFVVALFFLSLALLLGRTTWGRLYSLLPFHAELEVVRYLSAIQFAGLLAAALLAGAAWDAVSSRLRPALALALLLGAGFLLADRFLDAQRALVTVGHVDADFHALARRLARDRTARFLAHKRLGTGMHPYLNHLPEVARRPQAISYARGYHDTLSLYYLEAFDGSPEAFRLYGVKVAVTRGATPGAQLASLRLAWRRGPYRIFETEEEVGWFEFVRTPVVVAGDLTEMRETVRDLVPLLYRRGMLPLLVPARGDGAPTALRVAVRSPAERSIWVDGRPLRHATLESLAETAAARHGGGIRSRVFAQASFPNQYRARVDATAGETLVLKASYHPLWSATVDGRSVQVAHAGPNFMAIRLAPGRHRVRFRYRNPIWQKTLFVLSAAACVVAVVRAARRRVA